MWEKDKTKDVPQIHPAQKPVLQTGVTWLLIYVQEVVQP